MKILVNRSYGGLSFSDEFVEHMGFHSAYEHIDRDDVHIISAIETYGLRKASEHIAMLNIIEIPDEVTDWTIIDYDGFEQVAYVVDGKIFKK